MRRPARAPHLPDSVIREMTALVSRYHPDDGINLAQGFPDFAAPDEVKRAAREAIDADLNQYAVTWGTPALRAGIARTTGAAWGAEIDADHEITVCCGATESMFVALLATLDPGDEVVIFAPFYENYGPDCLLAEAVPRYAPLRPPDWSFDADELAAAIGPRTRGIVVNTPHNPTGKVFSRAELEFIAGLCREHDLYCYTDEIYERLVYDGEHLSMATLPGMRERTLTISGLSKTFSVTGWRVGWCIAPEEITRRIRTIHDYVTCGAAHPLQAAGAAALALDADYYAALREDYRARRDYVIPALRQAGCQCETPAGAYYAMTRIGPLLERFGAEDDRALAFLLVRDAGLAAVPGSSFYPPDSGLGRDELRFVFCKRMETLRRAVEILERL